MFYGAGYGYSLKPTFFLARVTRKTELEDHPVIFLGREIVRDLTALPALVQDGCVLIREEAARTVLWERLSYLRKSKKTALKTVLEHTGTGGKALLDAFPELYKVQRKNFVYHEIGELKETVFEAELWRVGGF